MKKSLADNPKGLVNTKVVFTINRETGEFIILDHYFKLDSQINTVFLIENDYQVPVCTGYCIKDNWCFQGMGITTTNTDPFVAIFKLLFHILNSTDY